MNLMRHLTLLFSASLLIVAFQNCGPAPFEVSKVENASNGDLGSNPDPQPPVAEPPGGDDPLIPSNPQQPSTGNFLLSIAKAGTGVVTSTPNGINCGSDCSESFAKSTSITLMAHAGTNHAFKGWGGACSGAGLTCTLKMDTLKSVTVSFEPLSLQVSIDAMIASMPSNSWKALPATQMKDVCPAPYSSYHCQSVIGAWGGGGYDEKRDRMVIMGGGHGDSWYNNVFAFDLGSMQWLRLSEMPPDAGKAPPEHWKDIRVETCGFYPKGPLTIPADFMMGNYVDINKCNQEPLVSQLDFQQPRSTHTYQRVYWDRIQDLYCYIPLGTYPSAQAETNIVMCLNPQTGIWSQMAKRPKNTVGRGQTALDSRGHIWALTASSGPIAEYSPSTDTWKTYGSLNSNAGGATDIDRKRDHMYVLFPLNDGNYSLRKFDVGNPTSLTQKQPYSEVSVSGDAPRNLGPRPGFIYKDDEDRFYAWGGGKAVYVLNPVTSAWTLTQASGDDPGPQSNWGTYGRFRYSSKRGVFVLVNSTTQNVFIYKP